jgi:hypothetical protein
MGDRLNLARDKKTLAGVREAILKSFQERLEDIEEISKPKQPYKFLRPPLPLAKPKELSDQKEQENE